MRRSVIVITLVSLLLAVGGGAAWWWHGAAASASPPTKNGYQPAAWRIEFDDGESALLFGTIHVGRADFYPLPAPVADPLANASCLVMELDINAQDFESSVALAVEKYGYLPTEMRLSALLPKDLWPQVERAGRDIGLTPAISDRMEPWLLASMVQVMAMAKLGYHEHLGVDQHLTTAAKNSGQQRVIGLETALQQLQIIAGNRAGGIDMLQQTITTDIAVDSKRLLNAWQQGDTATLEQLLAEMSDTPAGQRFMTELVVTRNRNWVEQLEQIWVDERCSVAVGAMHLIGQQSLVELLRQRGYRIERLDYAAAHEE